MYEYIEIEFKNLGRQLSELLLLYEEAVVKGVTLSFQDQNEPAKQR